ncbi:hypothetical protein [Pyxidicoccus xibeiensis]|uniref:hypothetical protein n=1 Tax=Pyxidicoccus xibeiensis TaxID=2906759 RepID=UPI0020A72AF2|nr:hypothetical protein [Pyxidicoccus xibeiensis]MCP3139743.1 hypothetical protein [Pyxidicoccus xibeiensis]
MDLLREFSRVYVAEAFIEFLFDNGYLDYDWAGDKDPDEMSAEELRPAPLSIDRLQDAAGDFWNASGGRLLFYAYQNVDEHARTPELRKYAYTEARWDVSTAVHALCRTGKVYQSRRLPRKEVVLFTGSAEKVLAANLHVLSAKAEEHTTRDDYLAFQEEADREA